MFILFPLFPGCNKKANLKIESYVSISSVLSSKERISLLSFFDRQRAKGFVYLLAKFHLFIG